MASAPSSSGLPASARATITFDELAREFDLSDRAQGWGSLPHDETGTLQLDGLRKRPRYFDGKFLTAADLTRDQDYIRQRQDDLARATGTGIVHGLNVRAGGSGAGDTVTIEAGHGVTPSGAIVSIIEERTIPLLDIAKSRQLDQVFGLSASPTVPVNARTGLFMLALRPVEFTANPTGSYPDASSGERTSEPGDIVEATAITLIAYEGAGNAADLTTARSRAASEIFGSRPGSVPQDALLLAMLALDRGTVVWCDPMMVRRETGADSPLSLGLGGRQRAISEAFLVQYQQHLSDIMVTRRNRGETEPFAAQDHFGLIPPAGPMPLGSILIGTDSLEQTWLPPGVQMQVNFIPEDEVGAVIEDSLGLEPIDLAQGNLDGLAISALIPLPRHKLHSLASSLRSLTMPITSSVISGASGSAISGLNNQWTRRQARSLSTIRPGSILDSGEAAQLSLWEAALQDAAESVPRDPAGNPVLFYTRQRTAPHAATLTGHSIKLVTGETDPIVVDPVIVVEGDDPVTPTPRPNPQGEEEREKMVEEKAGEFQLKTRLNALRKVLVPGANVALTDLLVKDSVLEVLFTNLVKDLETISPAIEVEEIYLKLLKMRSKLLAVRLRDLREGEKMLTKADIAAIGGDYRRENLGQGLVLLAKVAGKELVIGRGGIWLGDTALGIVVDRLLGDAPARQATKLAEMLAEIIAEQQEEKLRETLISMMKER